MSDSSKPVIISNHAAHRMQQRGATISEVEQAISTGLWQSAQRGKRLASQRIPFNAVSPVNGLYYNYKKIDVVFAEESKCLVVVTVKVYYHN